MFLQVQLLRRALPRPRHVRRFGRGQVGDSALGARPAVEVDHPAVHPDQERGLQLKISLIRWSYTTPKEHFPNNNNEFYEPNFIIQ